MNRGTRGLSTASLCGSATLQGRILRQDAPSGEMYPVAETDATIRRVGDIQRTPRAEVVSGQQGERSDPIQGVERPTNRQQIAFSHT